jgi:hypothetical protein
MKQLNTVLSVTVVVDMKLFQIYHALDFLNLAKLVQVVLIVAFCVNQEYPDAGILKDNVIIPYSEMTFWLWGVKGLKNY